MVKGLKMEEPPDALLPAEGGALEARVCTRSAHAVHVQCTALLTTYHLPLTTYHLLLTTYHSPLATSHLPPTTTTYHLLPPPATTCPCVVFTGVHSSFGKAKEKSKFFCFPMPIACGV